MSDTGIEQSALTPSKTQISQTTRAKNGALDDRILANYPELREGVKAWPGLPHRPIVSQLGAFFGHKPPVSQGECRQHEQVEHC